MVNKDMPIELMKLIGKDFSVTTMAIWASLKNALYQLRFSLMQNGKSKSKITNPLRTPFTACQNFVFVILRQFGINTGNRTMGMNPDGPEAEGWVVLYLSALFFLVDKISPET